MRQGAVPGATAAGDIEVVGVRDDELLDLRRGRGGATVAGAIRLDHQCRHTGCQRRRLARSAEVADVRRLSGEVDAVGVQRQVCRARLVALVAGGDEIDGTSALSEAGRAELGDVLIHPAAGAEGQPKALRLVAEVLAEVLAHFDLAFRVHR